MKSMEKVILGGLVATSVISMSYNVSNAYKLEQETYITVNRLNMRKGPSTDYQIAGTLNKGTKVVVIEKSSDGNWAKISYNSKEVWVNLSYLKKEEQKTTTDIKIGTKYITTANLNMRKGASTDYIKIATIPVDTQVTPKKVSDDGEWVEVIYNNQTGWVSKDYIKLYDNTETPSQPNKVEIGKNYKTTRNVYARKGPSTDYESIVVLSKGTKVKPTEVVKAGYWAKFEYNGQDAYVCTIYLENADESEVTPENPEKPEDPKPEDPKPENPNIEKLSGTYKTTANLNMRKGPGTDYARSIVVPYGSKVEASQITSDKEWTKITYNNQTGWVKSDYIEKVSSETITPSPVETIYYSTANINFRSGASTNSSKIGKIPANEKVIVTDFNSNHSWAKVTYNNKTGWVSAQYLTSKAPAKETEEKTYWNGVTTSNLNIRKGPDTSYSIVVTIPKNSSVKIYEEKSGWVKVKYKSYEGYCSSKYIK